MSKTTINSVTKSLEVLELLSRNAKGLQIKEISSEMKFNLSTTYHIVNTLFAAGYIQKFDNDRYFLGYKIPALNHAFHKAGAQFNSLSLFLEELHNDSKETCYLGVEHDNEIFIHKILESSHAIKVNSLYVGYTGCAHARATAKAIMAYWSEEKLGAYFENRQLEKCTENTVTSVEELLKELEDTKRNGFSVDEESFVQGVCCVSAPVFNAAGVAIASFGVSLPTERYWTKRSELIRIITGKARLASGSIGYTNPTRYDLTI